jgi:DNA-binding transcriptional LysR family regulator
MDFDSLRCFEAAATTLNFRAAAARVYLSPAAFSDRMQRLEADVGAHLFERTTRQVSLSEAGRRLLPLARQLLEGAERLRVLGREPDRPLPYELYVGTRYELGVSWLCPALKHLEAQRPERRLHMYNGDTPDLLSRLERGDLDAVVASMRLTSPNLAYAALHPEQYVLVSAQSGLLRREDAQRFTLVDVSRDLPLFRYFLDALPDAEPWPFARIEYMGGIGNIRRRLLDAQGRVAVLPHYFVKADLATGRFVRLFRKVALRPDTFRLVWRRDHPRAQQLLELAEQLRRRPLQ